MPERPPRPHPLWNLLALLLCGLAIGWMVGLSASPVIAKVLESLLGIAVTAMAVLAGLSSPGQPEPADEKRSEAAPEAGSEAKPPSALRKLALKLGKSDPAPAAASLTSVQVSLWPLAVFITALALAGSLGVQVRTNNLLGLNPDAFVRYWETRIDTRDKNLYRLALARTDPGLEALDQADRDREQESLRHDREQRLQTALDRWANDPDPKDRPGNLARVQAFATLFSVTPATPSEIPPVAKAKKESTPDLSSPAENARVAALMSGLDNATTGCAGFIAGFLRNPQKSYQELARETLVTPEKNPHCFNGEPDSDASKRCYKDAILACLKKTKVAR